MPRSRRPLPQNFNSRKTCGGKYCYATRLDAEQVIEEKKILQPELELSIYACLACKTYHLTRTKRPTL